MYGTKGNLRNNLYDYNVLLYANKNVTLDV